MKKLGAIVGVVVLTLALAPSAWAIIACTDCESPTCAKCIGACNGEPIATCEEWLASSCSSFRATSSGETLPSAFPSALERQAPEATPVRPDSGQSATPTASPAEDPGKPSR